MLGIRCPDRHALPRITLSKLHRPRRASLPRERVRSSAQFRRLACLGEGRESNSKRTYALSWADLSVTQSRTLRQALVKLDAHSRHSGGLGWVGPRLDLNFIRQPAMG